jgi:hypothetical protein
MSKSSGHPPTKTCRFFSWMVGRRVDRTRPYAVGRAGKRVRLPLHHLIRGTNLEYMELYTVGPVWLPRGQVWLPPGNGMAFLETTAPTHAPQAMVAHHPRPISVINSRLCRPEALNILSHDGRAVHSPSTSQFETIITSSILFTIHRLPSATISPQLIHYWLPTSHIQPSPIIIPSPKPNSHRAGYASTLVISLPESPHCRNSGSCQHCRPPFPLYLYTKFLIPLFIINTAEIRPDTSPWKDDTYHVTEWLRSSSLSSSIPTDLLDDISSTIQQLVCKQ